MVNKIIISMVFLLFLHAKLATLITAASFSCVNTHNIIDNAPLTADVVAPIVNSSATSNPVKTIVIDPGHGGRDPGGRGLTTNEKDVVLGISLILNDLLNRYFPDVNVIMTRDEDVFVPLHERARIANENKADLFLSIHCNIAPNKPSVRGTETFVLGLHRAQENLAVAMRENAVIAFEEDHEIHYDGYDPNSPEAHIIFSAYQNAYLGHSIRIASLVEQEFQTTAGMKSRGVKQAGFLVLRQATMPSVLVEAGFLSNREEEKYLASREGQREIALSILRAIQQYLRDWGYEPVVSNRNKDSKKNTDIVETIQQHSGQTGAVAIPASDSSREQNREIEVLEEFFSIQLLSSSNEIDYSHFDPIDGQSFFTMNEEDTWRLLNGRFNDYATAAKQRERLNKLGYADAFIIGIKNMKRIPVGELLSSD